MNFNNIITSFRSINDIKPKIKKIFLILGKDAFLFILFILLIEIIFAEFLFYKYVLSVGIQEPSLSGFIGFRESEYQSILKEWQAREEFLKNYSADNIQNPFQ